MNLDYLDILTTLVILTIIIDYEKNKFNFKFLSIFLMLLFLFVYCNNIFDVNLFFISLWKWGFIFIIISLFLIILGLIQNSSFDIYCLVFLVFIGSLLLINSSNLLTLYLGLELQTFSIFILIAKNRLSIKGSESGLKYFILGAISSGFYLLGLTILFLLGNSLEINNLLIWSNESIYNTSLIFIILSLCFKLGLFPLHFWIPDIYEGSSWEVVTIISTLPKISVIVVLIQILFNSNLMVIISILSMIIGTLGSINQSKIKRLFGYSGISHIGFIMLGYVIFVNDSFIVGNLYLIIYMIMMTSLFSLIINFFIKSEFIIEISYLKYVNRSISICWVLLILSIAGIPPLSGFISKWFLLWNAINFKFTLSSFFIILLSAVAAGYYLRLVKIIYFQKKSSFFAWRDILSGNSIKNELNLLVLGFMLYFNFFLIFNFSFIIDLLNFILN